MDHLGFRPWICTPCLVIGLVIATLAPRLQAQGLSKGYQILLSRGFQIQGLVTKDNGFHLEPELLSDSTYTGGYFDIGYNTVNWVFAGSGNSPNSNVTALALRLESPGPDGSIKNPTCHHWEARRLT